MSKKIFSRNYSVINSSLFSAAVCSFCFFSSSLQASSSEDSGVYVKSHIAASSYYSQRLDTKQFAMGIDTEESSLLFGFDKSVNIGSIHTEFGLSEIDKKLAVTNLNAKLSLPIADVLIGKMLLRNTVVTPYSFRRHDLIEFTHVLNGEHQVESYLDKTQLYAPSVAFDLNIAKGQRLGIWSSERDGHGDYNTVGVGYFFDKEQVGLINKAGIVLDSHNVAHNSKWIYGLIAGVDVNLSPSLTASFQGIGVMGTESQSEIESYSDMAGLDSYSFVAGVKKEKMSFLSVNMSVGLVLAYKKYLDIKQSQQLNVIPSLQIVLKEGFSIFSQLSYQYRERSLSVYTHGLNVDIGVKSKLDHFL